MPLKHFTELRGTLRLCFRNLVQTKHFTMDENIAAATKKLYDYYHSIRGQCKQDIGDNFWDLVVVTASDELQRDAYEKQIRDKLNKKEIPSGIPYLVYADPPGPRAGCGGSTMYVISELEKKFGWESLSGWRILLLNAGGQSQRLPSASVLGKIFSAIPNGNPMFQMLDVKLASYLPFLKKMPPGYFHPPSDTIEVYNLGNDDNSDWGFGQTGFTALAHPSTLKIGTGHGVYVLKEKKAGDGQLVEQRDCIEVLQKPSVDRMRERGAVLNARKNGHSEFVYTDSTFFFDHDVAKKLMNFYRKEAPLNCEIDAYGDFLQALGPKATIEYTKDTKNVSKIEDHLVEMREKVYHLLKGTPLTIIALNESQFHHFGTISECLDHFCGDVLGIQMCFQSWISSTVMKHADIENGSDDGPSHPKKKKVSTVSESYNGCVMASSIHKNSCLHSRCAIEYCNFEVPIEVHSDSLISGCEILAKYCSMDKMVFPQNVFVHTVPVNVDDGNTKFVTVIFGSNDNLKKKLPVENGKDLLYFGKPLDKLMKLVDLRMDVDAFKGKTGPVSLWALRLFPLAETMSQSMTHAWKIINCLETESPYNLSSENRVSMADIMEMKNVTKMLEYRNKLAKLISE